MNPALDLYRAARRPEERPERRAACPRPSELLVIPWLPVRLLGPHRYILPRKFIDGMSAYAAHWPGQVCALMRCTQDPDDNLDPVEVTAGELPFKVEVLPAYRGAIEGRIGQAGVVLATLAPDFLFLAGLCRRSGKPLVWLTEVNLKTRCQIIDAEISQPLRRWKRKLDTTLAELGYRRAIARAQGVQCNGLPTYGDYRLLNAASLLFFDSRIREDLLATDPELEKRTRSLLAGAPLRLVFSGRLVAIKGVDHLPLVAAELRRRRIPFIFDIYGAGDREVALGASIAQLGLGGVVRLRGALDFESQLLPRLRREADLFVCSHLQGDPACTYLETLACGTPIAGYDNEAWRGLSGVAGVGWLSPLGRPQELAQTIARLHDNRPALARAAYLSRDFARQHTFEGTMATRIRHLLDCARMGPQAFGRRAGEVAPLGWRRQES